MYKAKFDIEGVTPIVFSKYLDDKHGVAAPKKGEDKKGEAYNRRVSQYKAHTDENGMMYIQACSLSDCICAMARKAGDKKKGLQTWAKTFDQGLETEDNLKLGVHIKDSERHEGFFRVSKEKDTRIFKSFPMVSDWKTKACIIVEDDSIPVEKVKEYLELAGRRIGLGSFRKEKKGIFGKFNVKNFKVESI